MNFDFTPYFEKYQRLVKMADNAFEHVAKAYPLHVKCKVECSDCCYALFDITLIEALYINKKFNNAFTGEEYKHLLEKANTADRTNYRIKKQAYKESEKGKDISEIIASLSMARIRCPMLNDKDKCDIYEYRPITCRLYGIPTSIYNHGHTCGISGFEQGKSYPTVKLETIQNKLYEISAELSKALNSKYPNLYEVIVPLSMALLTDYNEDHLGIKTKDV